MCTIIWKGSDLTSDDVIVDTVNEMTNTPAQRKQLALELLQIGLFADPDTGRITRETRSKLMEIFQLGNWEAAVDIDEMHTIRAQREALDFEGGINPTIMELDDHTLHVSEHTKYVLSAEFRKLVERDEDAARRWLDHIQRHKDISVQRAMEMAGAGNVNASQAASIADAGNSPSDALDIMASRQGAQGGNPNLK